MVIIKEDYVSFETAKLLTKKSFDYSAEYESYYTLDGTIVYFKDNPQEVNIAPRITLQMAMKWLREIHNIQIELNWDKGNQLYSFQIWKPGKFQPEISSLDLWRIYKDNNYFGEWNYEEACEAAIKYCLKNLI